MQTNRWAVIVGDSDQDNNNDLKSIAAELGVRLIECTTRAEIDSALASEPHILFAFLSPQLLTEDNISLLSDINLRQADVALIHSGEDHSCKMNGVEAPTYAFCKPLNLQFMRELLQDALAEQQANADNEHKANNCPLDQFGLLHGSSRPMHKLFRTLRKVAQSETSVLLVGESGTGKELAARTIHQLSERCGKPFVAMNCGAIPADLVESELFGHEKGSFSGADRKRSGYFQQADGGTLFLDEIGEMSMDLQVKFLRVLETGEFRPVGSERSFFSNVRIIAATNRDPEDAVKNSLMREDLYFRIAQFTLQMPPLRERGSDIAGLAGHFLNKLNEANNTGKTLDQGVVDHLSGYSWPGNVRELKSAVERAYLMAGEKLEPGHFPQLDNGAFAIETEDVLRVSVGSSLDETERRLVFATLEQTGGDKKKTAGELGISLKTLYNKLKTYGAD